MNSERTYITEKRRGEAMTDEEMMTSSLPMIRKYMARHGLVVVASSLGKGNKYVVASQIDSEPMQIVVWPTQTDFEMRLMFDNREVSKWQVDKSRIESSPGDYAQLMGWGVDNLLGIAGL